jgi:hypothetical protein
MLLKIASEFSTAPGPRRIKEGKYSGEQFRTELLLPRVREAIASAKRLEVNLDGTSGYGTSFLEESFGGLIRENGMTLAQLQATMTLTSNEEPDLLDEIAEYMNDAERERVK